MEGQSYKIYFNRCSLIIAPSPEAIAGVSNVFFIDDDALERTVRIMLSDESAGKKLNYVLLSEQPRLHMEFLMERFPVVRAAGGIVMHEDREILTIFRNGFWDLPKGKIEKMENKKAAALREVAEETGLKSMNLVDKVGVTYHAYADDHSPIIIKETHWYRMHARFRGDLKPQVEEGITEVRWAPLEFFTAPEFQAFDSIRELLHGVIQGLTTDGTKAV
ncbi:MAG: hypothetical protein RLZZ370_1866 [Bacteroidota bacterium]|jgi:8-oxo-dGTP pyrophosphatase MutT (NUDIX family)